MQDEIEREMEKFMNKNTEGKTLGEIIKLITDYFQLQILLKIFKDQLNGKLRKIGKFVEKSFNFEDLRLLIIFDMITYCVLPPCIIKF